MPHQARQGISEQKDIKQLHLSLEIRPFQPTPSLTSPAGHSIFSPSHPASVTALPPWGVGGGEAALAFPKSASLCKERNVPLPAPPCKAINDPAAPGTAPPAPRKESQMALCFDGKSSMHWVQVRCGVLSNIWPIWHMTLF